MTYRSALTSVSYVNKITYLLTYKKSDPLDRKNHRPVRGLAGLSKIYESLIQNQLTIYCDKMLHDHLSLVEKHQDTH